jgi:type III restriction enzyme
MRFRFDANQPYQKLAVSAVTGAFDQALLPRTQTALVKIGIYESEFLHTTYDLDPGRLLKNVRAVQHQNNIEPDSELRLIRETIPTPAGDAEVAFPNLSVEMETGTGKTYVYLRTALELNRRFGLKKFVIVVPSVAIREGVLKTFKITDGHFAELFDNVP